MAPSATPRSTGDSTAPTPDDDEERQGAKERCCCRAGGPAGSADGERLAASLAQTRLTERLKEFSKTEQAEEWKFSMNDEWSRKRFTALLRRYGITPYRYKRQRYTTVMARAPASFVNEILWPEYSELNSVLTSYLTSITDRVINNHIHKNTETCFYL